MNHTAATIADVMRKRALGFAARGDTIFNGSMIAEELQTWAERLAVVPETFDPKKLSDGELILCLEEMRSRDASTMREAPIIADERGKP